MPSPKVPTASVLYRWGTFVMAGVGNHGKHLPSKGVPKVPIVWLDIIALCKKVTFEVFLTLQMMKYLLNKPYLLL